MNTLSSTVVFADETIASIASSNLASLFVLRLRRRWAAHDDADEYETDEDVDDDGDGGGGGTGDGIGSLVSSVRVWFKLYSSASTAISIFVCRNYITIKQILNCKFVSPKGH